MNEPNQPFEQLNYRNLSETNLSFGDYPNLDEEVPPEIEQITLLREKDKSSTSTTSGQLPNLCLKRKDEEENSNILLRGKAQSWTHVKPTHPKITISYVKSSLSFFRNKVPKRIMSDGYPATRPQQFKDFIINLSQGIKIIYTLLNTPHSLGKCKRGNQTIINRLRCRMSNTNIKNK